MTRVDIIKAEAITCSEGNIDYQAGFFDGACWAHQQCNNPIEFISAEVFLKENTNKDNSHRQRFLLYCDDKIRIISVDNQGVCYPEVSFVDSHEEPIDISSMRISHYLPLTDIR